MGRILILSFIILTIVVSATFVAISSKVESKQLSEQEYDKVVNELNNHYSKEFKDGLFEYKPNIRPCDIKEFEKVVPLNKFYSKVYKNGKWGFLNTDSQPMKLVSEIVYDDIQPLNFLEFRWYIFKVSQNNKWGLFNIITDDVIFYSKVIYDDISEVDDFAVKILKNGKYAICDDKGKLTPFMYDSVENFRGTPFFIVGVNSKKGIYSIDKRLNTDIVYDDFRTTFVDYYFHGKKYLMEGKKDGVWTKLYVYKY